MRGKLARQRAINILICLVLIFNIFLSVGPSYASQDNDSESIEEHLPDMTNFTREEPVVREEPIEEETDSQNSSREEDTTTEEEEVVSNDTSEDNTSVESPTNISEDNDSLADINITNDTWSDLNISNETTYDENISDINDTNQTGTHNLTEEEIERLRKSGYLIDNVTDDNVSVINDTNISTGNFTNVTPEYNLTNGTNVTLINITNDTLIDFNLTNCTNITLCNLSMNYTLENISLPNFTLESVYQNYLGNFTIVSNKGNIELFRVDDNLNVWFKLNNLTNGSNVTLDILLPVRLSDDFYFYLWKDINGERIQVPYNLSVNNETNTSIISLYLQDGVIDDDGKVNGIIEDPLQLFIPDYNVRTYRVDNQSTEVYIDTKKIDVRSSTGFLETVKVVDPLNLPEGPIQPKRFEDKLLKFRITNLTENSTDIYLNYNKILLKPNIWKFNPRTLEWYEFPFEIVNDSTVKITLVDGGFGDDDGIRNGIIVDDLGITNNWWNDSWNWRMLVNISHSGENLTDYQINITLTNSTFNFSKANYNLSDIRFTYYNSTSDTEILISHWMESNISLNYSDGDYDADFWVKVPFIENNTNTYLFIYYGNSDANSTSNGTATFLFFDDFNGSGMDASKWGTNAVEGTEYEYVDGEIVLSGDWNGGGHYFATDDNFTAPVAVEARVKINNDTTDCDLSFGFTPAQTTAWWTDLNSIWGMYDTVGGGSAQTKGIKLNGTWTGGSAIDSLDWEKVVLTYNGSYVRYWDSYTNGWITASGNITDEFYLSIAGDSDATGNNDSFDYIFVRKYGVSEPTETIGGEEHVGILNATIDLPVNHSQKIRYQQFIMNGTINCSRGGCGNVYGYAQYFSTATPLLTWTETTTAEFNSSTSYENVSVSSDSIRLATNMSGLSWWDSSWKYRQYMNVSNTARNLSNYQLELVLNSSNVAGNFNWTEDENATRFVWYNSSSSSYLELPYWIEEWNSSGQNSTIYVKVPFLENDTNTTIWLYYGNPSADSENNASGVFDLYLNFSELTITAESTQTGQGGDPYGDEILDSGRTFHSWGNNWQMASGYGIFEVYNNGSQILELNLKAEDCGEIIATGLEDDQTQTSGQHYKWCGSQGYGVAPDQAYNVGSMDTWQKVYAILDDFSVSMGYTMLPTEDDADYSANASFRDVRIRKYVSNAPEIYNGSEEAINLYPSGEYISETKDFETSDIDLKNISWNSQIATNTSIEIYTRTSIGADAAWWDSDWDYRQALNISNTAGNLTDFQVNITITSSDVGTNFNWTEDENATRFVWYNSTSSTHQELDYWIEEWHSSGENATIWVEVPQLINDTNTTIQMYYGNPGVATESNFSKVMTRAGLRYFYYNGTSFNTFYATGIDTNIDHNWDTGTVQINGSNSDENQSDVLSIRWEGWVINKSGGVHNFSVTTDDGSRLYTNGSLIIDEWNDQAPEEFNDSYSFSEPISIRYEWYENTGGATAQLGWAPADGSGHVYPIPSTSLRNRKYASTEPTFVADSEINRSEIAENPDNMVWSSWYLESNGSEIQAPDRRYLQYKIVMESNNSQNTPILEDITIQYQITTTGWVDMASSGTTFIASNPYDCGILNQSSSECTPSWNITPKKVGEYSLRFCTNSSISNISTACSSSKNISVWMQPVMEDFTASPDPVGRTQNTTLQVRLFNDLASPLNNYNISFIDETGNDTPYDIGDDLTNSQGYANIIYTVPSDSNLTTHTLNASYAGSTSLYILPVNKTRTLLVSSLPNITNITTTPQSVGFGYNITIRANVTDEVGLDDVLINITCDSTNQYDMNSQGNDMYNYTFNDTWETKSCTYKIIANNTDGITAVSSTNSFSVEVYANVTFSTDKDRYKNNEKVYLNTSVDNWTLEGWSNRLPINISGVDRNISNYSVEINLDSDDVNFDMFRENGSDIRFTYYNRTSSSEQNTSHWTLKFNSTIEIATIWVRVPYIEDGVTEKIYMYYGNSDANDTSNFTTAIGRDSLDASGYARYKIVGMKWDGGDEDCTSDADFDPSTAEPYENSTLGSSNWHANSFWSVVDTNDSGVYGGYSVGCVDFDDVWGSDQDDSEAYLVSYIWSPDNRTVNFSVGSDDTRKVWVGADGTLEHQDCSDQGLTIDDSTFNYDLTAGRTVVVMMVNEDAGGWGAQQRISTNSSGLRYDSDKLGSEPTITFGSTEFSDRGIQNLGSTNFKGYLRMLVQRWTGSAWQNIIPPVLDSTLYNISSYSVLNISEIWNDNGAWNTTTEDAGWYRVYVIMEDADSPRNTLNDTNGNLVLGEYNFSIIEAVLMLSNVSYENNYTYSINEYETGDVIDWINVTVQAYNNTAFNTNITLSVLNQGKSSVSWGPNSTQSCGDLEENETCEKEWDNSTNGYTIPLTATSGTYNFYWSVDMRLENGNDTVNDSETFLIHSIPNTFSKSVTKDRLWKPDWSYYNFTFENSWSENITNVSIKINCPDINGLNCTCIASGTDTCTYNDIANNTNTTISFNVSVNESVASADYSVNITLNYTNPGNENRSWEEYQNQIFEVRLLGILDINPTSYPVNVTRNYYYNFTTYINNTGDTQADNVWLNYSLPTNWTNSSGQMNKYQASLATSAIMWSNITAKVGQDAVLGSQTIQINSSADDGRDDWKNLFIYVYANTSLALTINSSWVDRGDSVEINATLRYDNGTAISGKNITFYNEDNETYLGSDLTDSSGIASIIYNISSDLPLGNHTINASFGGDTSNYMWSSKNETELEIHAKPSITNITISPNITGYGFNVTINATVNDSDNISSVVLRLVYPNGTDANYTMTNITSSIYQYIFNDTWQHGQYNFTVWANDTLGSYSESSQYNFTVNVSAKMYVGTVNSTYSANMYVNLSDKAAYWWNESWKYRQLVNVSNTAENLSEFQMNITINLTDEYNKNKVNSDCSDIRFTYYNSTSGSEQNISHWTSSCSTSGDDSIFWFKVPFIENNTDTLVYMYYGNSGASSVSSMNNTLDTGLRYLYYNGTNFNTYFTNGRDTSISHSWGTGQVQINGSNSDENQSNILSIRWQGWVRNRGNGNHTFSFTTDDGSRLYVNNSLIINSWIDQGPTEYNGSYNFSSMITIKYEWYESGGGATAQLGWAPADGSGHVYPIPSTYLRSRKYASTEPTYSIGDEENPGSYISNEGSTNFTGYLHMKVQYNNSGTWQDVDTVINDTNTSTLRTVGSGELNISEIWNNVSWYTSTNDAGTYRVYSEMVDKNNNILYTNSGYLNTTYIFYIELPPLYLNLSEIKIYDVTDTAEGNRHIYINDFVDSGLNKTFTLTKDKIYRVEFFVDNVGSVDWDINSTNVTHIGLNSSWNLDESNDIWYSNESVADDARSDNSFTGGIWNGNVTWNTTQLDGVVDTSGKGTFFYIVNTSSEEDVSVHFKIDHNTFVEEDYSVFHIIELDTDPPILDSGIYNLTNNSIFRGDPTVAYAKWNEIIEQANVTYNTVNSGTWVETTNTSVDDYWTNFTIESVSGWFLGIHQVKIEAKDESDNWNSSLDYLNLTVWGLAQVTSGSVNDSTINVSDTVRMFCKVTDDTKSDEGIANYVVRFYNSTAYLGNSSTNSSGWAYYDYTDNSAGSENLTCNITGNVTSYYKTDSNNYQQVSITTSETVYPYYTTITGPSLVHKGETVSLDVYWHDNYQLDGAILSINQSDSWSNKSTTSLSGTDDWANFSYQINTSMTPGYIQWKQYVNDTSGNTNVTPDQLIEVWGWAKITGANVDPGSMQETNYTNMSCRVIDNNDSSGIANYNVSFWLKNSTSTYKYLGYNLTNSSGWARLEFNVSNADTYTVKCNITHNATLKYNVTSENEGNDSLNVVSGPDADPPVASNYEINDTNIDRYACIKVSAQWDESINLSWAEYDRETIGSYMEENISKPYTNNWTNISVCTNDSWIPGNHSIKLYATDQYDNVNDTLEYKYFEMYGRSELGFMSPTENQDRGVLTVMCNVTDYDTSSAIENYTVTFWDEDLGYSIGSNTTNSSGVARIDYDFSTVDVGPEVLSCTIANEGYYKVTGGTKKETTITLYGTLYPNITNPLNNSIVHVGESLDLNSTALDENSNVAEDENGAPLTPTAVWYNSSDDQIATGEDITWNIPSAYTLGPDVIRLNESAQYYHNGTSAINVTMYSYSNITWVSPSSGNYSPDFIINMKCLVKDTKTGNGIANYPVTFFNGSDIFGTELTNGSGYANKSINTSYLEEDDSVLKCVIYDNSTLYYNDSAYNSSNITVDIISDPVVASHNATPNTTQYGNNITIYAEVTDNIEVDNVWVELESEAVNHSMTQQGATDIYNYTFNTSTFTAGQTYNYTIYANDTNGNNATPAIGNFSVTKANSTLNLYINYTLNDNVTVYMDSTVNITAVLVTPSDDTQNITVYRNGSVIRNTSSPATNVSNYNVSTTYNITAVYDGNENYSNASVMYVLTVLNQYDLIANEINFSDPNPVEGETITVSVNISNDGGQDVADVNVTLNVYFYNFSNGAEILNETQEMNISVDAGSYNITNFTWTAILGTYNFTVLVDADDNISETDESNNNNTVELTVDSWHIFYGSYNSSLVLMDANNDTFMTWGTINRSTILFYDYDSSVPLSNLAPLNETDDLDEADAALSMDGFNDSISRLYDPGDDGTPDNFRNITIAGVTIYNVPYVLSTNETPFITGLLYDTSDGGSEYNGTQDLVVVTLVNMSKVGRYGTYDYEIRVPALLEELTGATSLVTRVDELS